MLELLTYSTILCQPYLMERYVCHYAMEVIRQNHHGIQHKVMALPLTPKRFPKKYDVAGQGKWLLANFSFQSENEEAPLGYVSLVAHCSPSRWACYALPNLLLLGITRD